MSACNHDLQLADSQADSAPAAAAGSPAPSDAINRVERPNKSLREIVPMA